MTYEEFKEKVGSVILTGEGNCPVTPVVQMLQGKWKLQILYELCIKCPMRFGELKKVLKPITNTALTNALKELEECNYPIRRNGPSGYNKSRDKIRFLGTPDNTDDIKSTIDIPSWKRMAVCILKNDHLCKYMGFTQTKKQAERERELMAKYRNL